MKVFRIGKAQYIRDITGTGAKLFGGRWNRKGLAMLYTAQYRSLAALEVLVHLNKDEIPEDLKIITLDIPKESIKTIDLEEFEKIYSQQKNFQVVGSEWIIENETLCLQVPSIIIKEENNILLNPNHHLFQKVKIEKVDDFIFDKRLIK